MEFSLERDISGGFRFVFEFYSKDLETIDLYSIEKFKSMNPAVSIVDCAEFVLALTESSCDALEDSEYSGCELPKKKAQRYRCPSCECSTSCHYYRTEEIEGKEVGCSQCNCTLNIEDINCLDED